MIRSKQIAYKILASILPKRAKILRVLGGPLAGRNLCCRFNYRPHCLFGHYEKEVLQAIQQNLKPGQVAYDIGANIGYLSLCMAKCVSQKEGGRVYAFEPGPDAFRMLVTNTQLNPQWAVEPFQVALSDTIGIEPFSSFDFDVVSRLGDHTVAYTDARRTRVRTETLDEFVKLFELEPPNFIKMDVEGHELHVLRGMRHILATKHPKLIIETHTAEENGVYTTDTADEVVAMLSQIGYKCEFVQHSHPRQVLCT